MRKIKRLRRIVKMRRLVLNIVIRYRQHVEYVKGVRELHSLSDHDLHDIGITRSEIHYIVKENIDKRKCRKNYYMNA
jgi:uncharacterized protein YjiS (DUF1127 family)